MTSCVALSKLCVVLCLFLVPLTPGCKGSGDKKEEPKSVVDPRFPPFPLDGFDLDETRKKLQGVWHIPASGMRPAESWEVKGNQVTVWNGVGEKRMTLTVFAPCWLLLEMPTGGATHQVFSVFAFDGGDLRIGAGGAALRQKDGRIAACMGGVVYTLVDGLCTRYMESKIKRLEWDIAEVPCSLRKEGENEIFEVQGRWGGKLMGYGDAFATEQLVKAEKLPSWDAAKAKLPASQ